MAGAPKYASSASGPSAARSMPSSPSERHTAGTLIAAATAALLASSCCLLPLALVSVGITGAWLGTLRILQPYSPIFIAVSITALFFSGRSLFKRSANSANSCTIEQAKKRSIYKTAFWLTAALTLLLLLSPVIAPWFY